MHAVDIPRRGAFAAWRAAARSLLALDLPPETIMWSSDTLFAKPQALAAPAKRGAKVPKAFLDLCESVICHRDPARCALLYAILWRLQSNPRLLDDASDEQIARACALEKSVRRDCHKMKAFVRFREAGASKQGRRRFAAWFEPDHHIVETTAPFFARRFADMDWIIATPFLGARFEAGELHFDEAFQKVATPPDDVENLWRAYYVNIFNPARLKVKAMEAEMPKKYWKNLPEAPLIPGLVASAQGRAEVMEATRPEEPSPKAKRIRDALGAPAAAAPEPEPMPPSLEATRAIAAGCERCHLYRNATQTVFGEGPNDAAIMFVGEQPGDKEDLAGRPFVGPAGRLFNEILGETGIDRGKCYVTNAVKHFKHEMRGKFRLHKRPDTGEVQACRWWLKLEKEFVKPKLIVALGATAAQALTGNGAGILKRRGRVEDTGDGTRVFMTVHPSSLLRMPDEITAQSAREEFKRDLEKILEMVPEAA
jgi:probable DNA metabolism protein